MHCWLISGQRNHGYRCEAIHVVVIEGMERGVRQIGERAMNLNITRLLPAIVLAAMGLAMGAHVPPASAQRSAQPSCAPAVTRVGGTAQALASAGNSFGFRLLDTLLGSSTRPNVFISPVSTAIALDMAYNGAGGSTRQAMSGTLALRGMSQAVVRRQAAALLGTLQSADRKAGLTVANSVWARSGIPFRRQFLQDARSYYGARVATLDFRSPQAMATINGWVSCATHGKIPTIVDRIPPSMIMYLVNAVYFHGAWSDPFPPTNTRPQPFTTAGGQQKSVPLMSRIGSFPYYAGSDFQAISLPYSAGRFSMTVILPRQGLSLQAFARRLTPGSWQTWMSQLRPESGSIALPRFTLSNDFQLVRPLTDLGMGVAFSRAADFSGICVGGCRISQVRHKTYLNVDEAGTTAAAATSVGIEPTAVRAQQFSMVVNRPFVLAIRDGTTNALLFLGGIGDPS